MKDVQVRGLDAEDMTGRSAWTAGAMPVVVTEIN
jgi:hypothetical protein